MQESEGYYSRAVVLQNRVSDGGAKKRERVALVRRMRCFKCWRIGVPPAWLVVLGALLVQVGFGLYPVIVKKFAADTDANPVVFNFYRSLFCFPLLFLCAFIVERKPMFPNIRMLLVFVALGFTGMFGNQLLYVLGVYLAGPAAASAIQPVIPVWTTLLALATCTEKLPSFLHVHTWAKLVGILLATGGAVELTLTAPKNQSINVIELIHAHSNSTSISTHVLGCFSLLGNTLCMAIYILIQKRFIFNRQDCQWKYHPIYVTAYGYFFGAFFLGLSNVYYIAKGQTYAFKIPSDAIYALIYAVFITSAMCYMLITWSNLHLSATIVTSFWPTQVLVTVVGSYLATGDVLAPLQYIGAVMVLLALFLVLFSNHMEGRWRDGKSVPRVDCHMTSSSSSSSSTSPSLSVQREREGEEENHRLTTDETKPLLNA